MGKAIDINLKGEQFGELLVIEYRGVRHCHHLWLCQCSCGRMSEYARYKLLKGKSTACRHCTHPELKHGFADRGRTDKLYRTWTAMKARCYDKNNVRFNSYGGRGIKICDKWRTDHLEFRNWALSNGYEAHLTIERLDVNGDYTPDNCTWITSQEQAKNKTTNRWITWGEQTRLITDWAKDVGGSPSAISARLAAGWTLDRALTTPVRRKIKNEKYSKDLWLKAFELREQGKPYKLIAALLSINEHSLRKRLCELDKAIKEQSIKGAG